ncbi:MAG: exonuclease SbcCD subunit D [Candidatus Nanopelagicales bacterium]
MRLLHTSDWHLGRSLHGVDLLDAQRAFIDQIVALAQSESVDGVLVAGDVFDRAVPPVETVALFSEALARLVEHCEVVVLAGNHDSATRLGFGAQVHRKEIHFATDISRVGEAVELRAGDESVLIYPIPYLDPDAARSILSESAEPLARSHEAVMSAAMRRINADRERRAQAHGPRPAVVTAHAFVVGGSASDSERDITVGTVASVPVELFDGVDYVALGHLHGPQSIGAANQSPTRRTVEYSGSPLRYSFSERNHAKSVTIVDIEPNGVVATKRLALEQPRGMGRLEGSLDEVLCHPQLEDFKDRWVQVLVTDSARPEQLHERIREVLPFAISIEHRPELVNVTAAAVQQVMTATDPTTVCSEFFARVTGSPPSEAEVTVLSNAYVAARESSQG